MLDTVLAPLFLSSGEGLGERFSHSPLLSEGHTGSREGLGERFSSFLRAYGHPEGAGRGPANDKLFTVKVFHEASLVTHCFIIALQLCIPVCRTTPKHRH
jgi:hypothetical protein